MPDPFDELEHFTTPGLTMDPLPAAEVRRRGTRMRRRNQALATIGGVAAVAVIATPFALAANRGSTDSTPPPANQSPSVTWVREVPADFPLTDGMTAGTQLHSRPAAPSGLLTVCGTDVGTVVSGAGAVDVAGTTRGQTGSEGSEGRSLTLYVSDTDAAATMDALRDVIAGCATDPNGTGMTLVNEVSDASAGGDESLLITQQARAGDGLLSDLTTMEVVRTGNAVFVTSSYTTAGGAQVVDAEVRRLGERSAAVVDAMCVFAADPC